MTSTIIIFLIFVVVLQQLVVIQNATFAFHTTFVTSPRNLHATRTTELYGILGRFRKNRKIEQVSTIKVGDQLSNNSVDIERVVTLSNDDSKSDNEQLVVSEPMSILDVLGPNKALLIGMPGAFTTTCSQRHLPGYIESAKKLKSLGIDTIAVITTNDRFVNQEWAKQQGIITNDKENSPPPITMLCDADGDFIKSIGLAEDMGFGIGVRSKRFVIMTDNGVVTNVLTDEGMDDCSATSAANVIKLLTPEPVPGSSSDAIEIDGKVIIGVAGAIGVAILASMIGGGNDTPTVSKTTQTPKSSTAPKSQLVPTKKVEQQSSDTNFSLINEYLKNN